MKKLVFVGVLLLSFVIFPEMTTENIIKYIDGKNYKTAAQNLIIYQKESKFKVSSEKEAEETVKDILGGVRSTCTYVGASKLKELSKRTTFIRVQEQENQVFNG